MPPYECISPGSPGKSVSRGRAVGEGGGHVLEANVRGGRVVCVLCVLCVCVVNLELIVEFRPVLVPK